MTPPKMGQTDSLLSPGAENLIRAMRNWTEDFPPAPETTETARVARMNDFVLPFGRELAGYVLEKYPSGILDVVHGPHYDALYAADDEKLKLMQYYRDIPEAYRGVQQVLDTVANNRRALMEHEARLFEPLGTPPLRITSDGGAVIHTFTYDAYQLLAGAARTFSCVVVDPVIIIVTKGMWENPSYTNPCSVCLAGGGKCLECSPIDAELWPDGFGAPASSATVRRRANKAFLNTLAVSVVGHNKAEHAQSIRGRARTQVELNLSKNEPLPTYDALRHTADARISKLGMYYSKCRQFENDGANSARRRHAECAASVGDDVVQRIQCTLNACPDLSRVLVPVVLSISTGDTHSNILVFERTTHRVYRVEPMHPCLFQCWDKLYAYIIAQVNARTPSPTPWTYERTLTRGEAPERSFIFQNPRADVCAGWGLYLYMLLLINPDVPATELAAHIHAKAPNGRWTDESSTPVFKDWEASVHVALRDFMRFSREIVYGARFDWKEFYGRGAMSNYLAAEAIAAGKPIEPWQVQHHIPSMAHPDSPTSYGSADWLGLDKIRGYGSTKTYSPNYFGMQWTSAPVVECNGSQIK